MTASHFDYQHFLKNTPEDPGIYRMLNSQDSIIYIGKAKNLKKRLTSYFRKTLDTPKTRILVSLIDHIEISVTNTELEALLLEQNLIKKHRPKFNILLRDDKSYPYIFLSNDKYPRLSVHRGSKKSKGEYFGPFPSAGAVRESLSFLQKLFQVRQCENSYFSNRSRPCLQYQIKRCKAPCVEFLDVATYDKDVERTRRVLKGKNQKVIEDLVYEMDQASQALNFEDAAIHRDQISRLRHITSEQAIEGNSQNLDVIAVSTDKNVAVVHLLFYRNGRVIGSKNYYPKIKDDEIQLVMEAFITQFYLDTVDMPSELVLSHSFPDQELVNQSLNKISGKKIKFSTKVKGQRKLWLELAQKNSQQELALRLASNGQQLQRLQRLTEVLNLSAMPRRMECFDISHTAGVNTQASCVVFGQKGPDKQEYRRFNIKNITGGDDYAAMNQALTRRFKNLVNGEGVKPEILFIDGGKGQLRQAKEVLEELEIDGILLVAIAKGAERKVGAEKLFFDGDEFPILLNSNDPALHLIQHIRDESHRFAITGHRNQRAKNYNKSELEVIPGIGQKRRQKLLKQFGGLTALKKASVSDLASIPGISQTLAQKLYDYFQN